MAEEELAEEVATANSRIDEVGTELSSINEQLGEAKARNHIINFLPHNSK